MGLPEIPRGSAALTGVTGDGGSGSGVVQEKAVLDYPIREMAVCRTDILLLYCTIVYLRYTDRLIYTHRDTHSVIPTVIRTILLPYY